MQNRIQSRFLRLQIIVVEISLQHLKDAPFQETTNAVWETIIGTYYKPFWSHLLSVYTILYKWCQVFIEANRSKIAVNQNSNFSWQRKSRIRKSRVERACRNHGLVLVYFVYRHHRQYSLLLTNIQLCWFFHMLEYFIFKTGFRNSDLLLRTQY